jgi:hypothetical protein
MRWPRDLGTGKRADGIPKCFTSVANYRARVQTASASVRLTVPGYRSDPGRITGIALALQ